VKQDGTRPVPMHLRNAPTKLMKQLDYGKGYRYAHDEEGGFAAGERYLPDGMAEPGFYQPVERGLEIKIAQKLRDMRARNAPRVTAAAIDPPQRLERNLRAALNAMAGRRDGPLADRAWARLGDKSHVGCAVVHQNCLWTASRLMGETQGKTPPPGARAADRASLQSRPQTRTAALLAGFLLDGSRAHKAAPISVPRWVRHKRRTSLMDILLQQIINGLVLGSMYALIALGYTMVYGIIQLINFAHGEVLMIGALTSWSCIGLMQDAMPGAPGWLILLLATLIACVVAATLNFTIEKVAYKPLRNSPRLAPLITAIGMSILLQTLAMIIWKPNYKPYPTMLPAAPFEVGGAFITPTQMLILGVTAMALAALMYLVNYTNLGRAMRATAENPRVASLMGVKPDMVISATFIIGAILAAIAGIMYASNYGTAQHTMGFLPGLKAFTAAVFGGIGNLAGAVVGGILLGLIEAIGSGYIGTLTGGLLGSHYTDIFAFIVLIIILTLRPSGLLGERVADRA
jgi:branched-chain amino acid transport system permease protein